MRKIYDRIQSQKLLFGLNFSQLFQSPRTLFWPWNSMKKRRILVMFIDFWIPSSNSHSPSQIYLSYIFTGVLLGSFQNTFHWNFTEIPRLYFVESWFCFEEGMVNLCHKLITFLLIMQLLDKIYFFLQNIPYAKA